MNVHYTHQFIHVPVLIPVVSNRKYPHSEAIICYFVVIISTGNFNHTVFLDRADLACGGGMVQMCRWNRPLFLN